MVPNDAKKVGAKFPLHDKARSLGTVGARREAGISNRGKELGIQNVSKYSAPEAKEKSTNYSNDSSISGIIVVEDNFLSSDALSDTSTNSDVLVDVVLDESVDIDFSLSPSEVHGVVESGSDVSEDESEDDDISGAFVRGFVESDVCETIDSSRGTIKVQSGNSPTSLLLGTSAQDSQVSSGVFGVGSGSQVGLSPVKRPSGVFPSVASPQTPVPQNESAVIAQLRAQIKSLKADQANVDSLRKEVNVLRARMSKVSGLQSAVHKLRENEKVLLDTIEELRDALAIANNDCEQMREELASFARSSGSMPTVGSQIAWDSRARQAENRVQRLEAEIENLREAWYLKHQKLVKLKDAFSKLLQDKDAFFVEE